MMPRATSWRALNRGCGMTLDAGYAPFNELKELYNGLARGEQKGGHGDVAFQEEA